MPYQYKKEPLNNDEVNRITNACDTFREKFVVWTLLDTGLRLSEFADLKKDNIQWQERRLVIYGKSGPYGKKTKRRIIPMTERVRRLGDEELKQFLKESGFSLKDVTLIGKKTEKSDPFLGVAEAVVE